MTFLDGFFTMSILLLFAGILALSVERGNGKMNGVTPEPTVTRQLEACQHKLATCEQSVEVWRSLATQQKIIIEDLSKALENS